jgi:hypothetical protein
MLIPVIVLVLLTAGAVGPSPELRSAADLPQPDSTASLDERIRFYVERLGDTSYVAYRLLEDVHVEWYEAAEQLGVIGAPAVPPLIGLLRSSDDVFERTQVFYALSLAAQDHRVRLGLGIQRPNCPMAYPEPAAHQALREQWLRWWEVNGDAIMTLEGTQGAGWGPPYVVTQPIDAGHAGVVPCDNTYVRWGDAPGIALLLTVAECRVSTPDGFVDRNAASLMGIHLRSVGHTGPAHGQTWSPGLFGDTLRVTMDLSHLGPSAEPAIAAWRQVVVDVTTQCMVENARREPRAAFLDIVVEGPAEFARLAGVRSLR